MPLGSKVAPPGGGGGGGGGGCFTSLKHRDKERKLQNYSSLKLEGAEL